MFATVIVFRCSETHHNSLVALIYETQYTTNKNDFKLYTRQKQLC